jgi:hypothetical protein
MIDFTAPQAGKTAPSGVLHARVQHDGRERIAAGGMMSAMGDRALAAPPFVFKASSSA